MSERCEHCERPTQRDKLGLCPTCATTEGVRVLYVRRRGWTPELELRIRRLAARAKRRLPLFDEGPTEESAT